MQEELASKMKWMKWKILFKNHILPSESSGCLLKIINKISVRLRCTEWVKLHGVSPAWCKKVWTGHRTGNSKSNFSVYNWRLHHKNVKVIFPEKQDYWSGKISIKWYILLGNIAKSLEVIHKRKYPVFHKISMWNPAKTLYVF